MRGGAGSRGSSRRGISSDALGRGKRLSALMEARGWTFNCQVAYDLNVTESSLSRWRSGGPMSLENAVALADRLGTSIDWLVLGCDDVSDRPPELPSEHAEVMRQFSRLSHEDREIVLAVTQALVRSQATSPASSATAGMPVPE